MCLAHQCTQHRSAAATRRAWLAIAWLVLLVPLNSAGCRTFSKRDPISQSVATCRTLTQQGVNAMERGDWKRAESLLARAVQTAPNDVDARRNYAETLWHRGARAEALVQLEEARKLAPEDPSLAVRTGEAYLDQGRIVEAAQMADEALRWDSRFARGWALRGRVAAAGGHTREALADYQRSLSYAPHDPEIVILLAETYRQLNQPQRALSALQTLAERYSPGEEPQQVLHLEGLALTALGRYGDATRCLSQAVNRDRPTADLLCNLAQAEFLAGQPGNAQYALRQALALEPEHRPSRDLAARMAALPPAGKTVTR